MVEATKAALHAGIDVCAPGVEFSEIGCAIEAHVAGTPYEVGDAFIGHGVGKHFHAAPWVFHVANREPEGKMQVRTVPTRHAPPAPPQRQRPYG